VRVGSASALQIRCQREQTEGDASEQAATIINGLSGMDKKCDRQVTSAIPPTASLSRETLHIMQTEYLGLTQERATGRLWRLAAGLAGLPDVCLRSKPEVGRGPQDFYL
jgi:hypothetical protein